MQGVIRTILKQKKPKAKIALCSGMGKFCPPAAASPKLPRGNTYAADSCAIGGGRGGEVINIIGRGAHLACPKSFSWFRASFLKAREAPLKKRKRSETARPQFWFWIKIRVNPIYLVILWLPPLVGGYGPTTIDIDQWIDRCWCSSVLVFLGDEGKKILSQIVGASQNSSKM